jgi:hypothetical protein
MMGAFGSSILQPLLTFSGKPAHMLSSHAYALGEAAHLLPPEQSDIADGDTHRLDILAIEYQFILNFRHLDFPSSD